MYGKCLQADDVSKHKERAKRFNLPEPLSKEEVSRDALEGQQEFLVKMPKLCC